MGIVGHHPCEYESCPGGLVNIFIALAEGQQVYAHRRPVQKKMTAWGVSRLRCCYVSLLKELPQYDDCVTAMENLKPFKPALHARSSIRSPRWYPCTARACWAADLRRP
jgi:hypothetical protein